MKQPKPPKPPKKPVLTKIKIPALTKIKIKKPVFKIKSISTTEKPPTLIETLRQTRNVDTFRPSPKALYLDNLVGVWVPGFIPNDFTWKGMNEINNF